MKKSCGFNPHARFTSAPVSTCLVALQSLGSESSPWVCTPPGSDMNCAFWIARRGLGLTESLAENCVHLLKSPEPGGGWGGWCAPRLCPSPPHLPTFYALRVTVTKWPNSRPNNRKVAHFQTEWQKKNVWLRFADLEKIAIYIAKICQNYNTNYLGV